MQHHALLLFETLYNCHQDIAVVIAGYYSIAAFQAGQPHFFILL